MPLPDRRPDLAIDMGPLLKDYAELRYGTGRDLTSGIAGFARAVARLKVRAA